MKNITVFFPKINYTQTSFGLDQIADSIIEDVSLIHHTYKEGFVKSDPKFCGFYLPSFQRGKVWSKDKKIRLIESIFCGIDIGTFVYVSNGESPKVDGWLIDGQQRLSAIEAFVKGKISIFDGQFAYKDMNNVTLDFNGDEPTKALAIWKRANLNFKRIENVSDINILKDLYNRLNFGGVVHKESERA